MNHQDLIDAAAIKLDAIGARMIMEEHPIEASRSGQNTVFHHCDVYQGRPSYASCLMIMDMTFEGTNKYRPECVTAIEKGNCPAVEMRKAELRAGKALFFVGHQDLMRRRQEQAALDRENSPIQFRRPKENKGPVPKFVPTQFTPEGRPIFNGVPLPVDGTPARNRVIPIAVKTPTTELTDDDFNTNIMQQVVQKVLNDNTND